MIITISGVAGSGKSTLSKNIANKLSWHMISVGDIRRQLALEKGMTLAEFNKLGETDPSTDVDVDMRVVEEIKKYPNAIAEGRVMFHYFPDSLKIYVKVSLEEATKRTAGSQKVNRLNEAHGDRSIETVKQNLLDRQASDRIRYEKYYGIDVFDESNYDLVIDTTDLQWPQTLKIALDFIRQKTGLPALDGDIQR